MFPAQNEGRRRPQPTHWRWRRGGCPRPPPRTTPPGRRSLWRAGRVRWQLSPLLRWNDGHWSPPPPCDSSPSRGPATHSLPFLWRTPSLILSASLLTGTNTATNKVAATASITTFDTSEDTTVVICTACRSRKKICHTLLFHPFSWWCCWLFCHICCCYWDWCCCCSFRHNHPFSSCLYHYLITGRVSEFLLLCMAVIACWFDL